MKGRVVALDHYRGRSAAALISDGRLEDFLIDPPDDSRPVPGAIYRATAERPLKGQGGVIVRLAGADGFFRAAKGVKPGQSLLVQVTSYAEPAKAAPVSDRLMFKGRTVIVTPGAGGVNISRRIRDEETRLRLRAAVDTEMLEASGYGAILRSQAAHADSDEIAAEVDSLTGLCRDVLADTEGPPELLVDGPDAAGLAWREWSLDRIDAHEAHAGAFEALGVLDELDALARGAEALPGGGVFYVEPTRALTAVDVNTGGDLSPAAALMANIATAAALPRALRLRGLGGQITVDFAPLAKKDRRQIEAALRKALQGDPIETSIVGWTPLGHLELQRKRERLPLWEEMT